MAKRTHEFAFVSLGSEIMISCINTGDCNFPVFHFSERWQYFCLSCLCAAISLSRETIKHNAKLGNFINEAIAQCCNNKSLLTGLALSEVQAWEGVIFKCAPAWFAWQYPISRSQIWKKKKKKKSYVTSNLFFHSAWLPKSWGMSSLEREGGMDGWREGMKKKEKSQ